MKPKILIGVETLLSGGAESFAVRLANSLSGVYDVTIFLLYANKIDKRLIARQENHFKLMGFKHPLDFFIIKFDSLLFKLGIDYSLRSHLVIKKLKRVIEKETFTILHSNQFKTDYIFYRANLKYKLPHVSTIHGDYINFYYKFKNQELTVINYHLKAKELLKALAGIAFISDHQLAFFKDILCLTEMENRSRKIYNGIDLPLASMLRDQERNMNSEFTYGMVARGIPEKGWEIAVQAFLQLNLSHTRLILVGESEHLNQLKIKYNDPRIQFAGYSMNPFEWIEKFDVGLLPTTFSSESLPTSIIEYLALGKPVIASDKGEIRNMLEQNDTHAGIILKIRNGIIDQSDLSAAMKQLLENKAMYNEMKSHAKSHAEVFSMKKCLESYLGFYQSLLVKAK